MQGRGDILSARAFTRRSQDARSEAVAMVCAIAASSQIQQNHQHPQSFRAKIPQEAVQVTRERSSVASSWQLLRCVQPHAEQLHLKLAYWGVFQHNRAHSLPFRCSPTVFPGDESPYSGLRHPPELPEELQEDTQSQDIMEKELHAFAFKTSREASLQCAAFGTPPPHSQA